MIDQGLKISTCGKNVYVKIPVVNSKGKFTGKVIKELNRRKIKLNITAVYNSSQTKKILSVIDKKHELSSQFLLVELQMLVKIQYQKLVKVYQFRKDSIMLKFYGQV